MGKKKRKIDLNRGGKMKCDNGTVVKVKPHSERVFLTIWEGNGAMIETLCYSERVDGEVDSDRIHLLITDGRGKRKGWLMNIEDAESIINGLSAAMEVANSMDIPRRG